MYDEPDRCSGNQFFMLHKQLGTVGVAGDNYFVSVIVVAMRGGFRMLRRFMRVRMRVRVVMFVSVSVIVAMRMRVIMLVIVIVVMRVAVVVGVRVIVVMVMMVVWAAAEKRESDARQDDGSQVGPVNE